jgi:glycosyltransferase involved in cell wall biosynthesis
MSSMRIVIITDVYFPRVNGVSTSIRTFRRELESLGHEVWLIAPDYGEVTDDESWILRVPSRVVYVDPEDRMMRFREVMALEDKLTEIEPDLIHIQTPFVAHYAGIRLARRLGVPTVLTYHTYFEEYLFYYIRFLPRFLLRWSVRHLSRKQCAQVDSVVVPTQAFNDVLSGYGVPGTRHINPTGIELERFASGDGGRFKQQRGIDEKRPSLVFVGRIVHEKNIEFLIRVVEQVRQTLPDILLILAGEGPAEGYLKSVVGEKGLEQNLYFVGNLQCLQDLLDCYCAGDVFVFSSRTETQGLVLLEAMALGVPVVSTARMGTCDILNPGLGALVAEEEVDDFAGKVLKVLADEKLAHRLGEEGKEYVHSWSAATMAKRLEGIYRDTVASTMTIEHAVESEE